MKRKLIFEDGIISDEIKLDITDIFPETIDSFRQRKQYYEYYYDETEVKLNMDILNDLNNRHYSFEINSEEIIIKY